jgi:K+-transporting ATPase ATPase C chain
MFPILRTASILFCMLTIVTGVAYPIAVTLVAQVAFPHAANGSLFERLPSANPTTHGNSRDWRSGSSAQKNWVGSELVGQAFSDPKYFWSRPSATAPVAYNGLGGCGSNQATTNPALAEAVQERITKLRAEDPENKAEIPVDLVTASGSGLDPHISEAAARYQVGRVARVRKIDPYSVNKLVLSHTERPTIGVFGQTRINVLKLNLALDALHE